MAKKNSTVPAATEEEPQLVDGVDVDLWQRRISASRTRREKFEQRWQEYARLHTNAYQAVKDRNDDISVTLPSGDQVKIGLVHRNLEQTFALLDITSVSVKATRKDFTRAQDQGDTHSEAIVEQALPASLSTGGILGPRNVADKVKRDGVMMGHGVSYSWWRREEIEVEGDAVAELIDDGAGNFTQQLDPAGQPIFTREKIKKVIYDTIQDDYVSPLEFLFDASCLDMVDARWRGCERITTVAAMRAQGFEISDEEVKGSAYLRRTLYGEDPQTEEDLEEDSVKHIVVWDVDTRRLLNFLETCTTSVRGGRSSKGGLRAKTSLKYLRSEAWPVEFDHPDKTPFEVFIPIPANDMPYGVSQVEHIKTPALEADKLRTRAANLTRQLKFLLLYRKGAIDKTELDRALASPDSSAVSVDVPEEGDWDSLFKPIQSQGPGRELYDQIAAATADVRETSGVSDVPSGGADTATEADNIFKLGSARVERKRDFWRAYITGVADTHRCYLRAFAPEGQVTIVPDVDGAPLPLVYGRAAFAGVFRIEVLLGDSSMSPVRQKFMQDMFGSLKGAYGPQFDLALLRQMLTLFDVKESEGLLRAARQGLMLAMPQAFATPGAPAPIPGQQPGPPSLQDMTNGGVLRAAANALVESPGARR